jgi:hypothetical protein
MILWKGMRLCDSFLLLVQRDWVEIGCYPTSLLLGKTSSKVAAASREVPQVGRSDLKPPAATLQHHKLVVVTGIPPQSPLPGSHSQNTATMGVPFEALLPYGIMVSCADRDFATRD